MSVPTYPHPLKLRVMAQGRDFIVEQFCGTAGWWPIGTFGSLDEAKREIEETITEEKAVKRMREVYRITADGEPDPQPPTPGTFVPTLSERIRARIMAARFDGLAVHRPSVMSQADLVGAPRDHFLLDADTVMPIIEKLIAVVATAEEILNCAAEFTEDMVCCSGSFQAAEDKIDELKKVVGP